MKAGTSYIDDENSFSVDNVSFAINHFIPKADCTQVKVNQSSINNNIYIYNTTALPNITRIEFEMTAASLISAEQAAQTYVYSGTSSLTSLPSSGNVTGTISGQSIVFNLSSSPNSYFRFASSKVGGAHYFTKMVITYGESVAPETKPEKPTFSVTPGEVAKGTSVTISSKGATSLTLKSKTADAADWTIQNIPNANTHDVIINENITYNVVGHNSIGDSEAAEASYTVKADTPVPGGNITATVIFKNQTNFTYESGKNVVWVAEGYPSITFSTSATSKQNYPKKDGDNLRMYTSSSNKITVNAPEGYKIKSVSGVYTNTSNTGFKINNETTVVKSGVPYEFAEDVSSFVLVSYKKSGADKSANSTYFSSFTFVLVPDAPVVPEAPSAVTVTPAKAEAKVGENVSVTIAANGTPAPDIYYTIDGTVPTTESAKYAKAFDVTCDALADNEESKVVTINGLAQNSEGQASGSATVAFTRNDASITVKDAKGNTIGADGASLVLEDGAAEFKATSTGDGTIYWSSANNKIAKVENGIITPLAVGTTTITASSDKTGKHNACETSFTLTITSPYTYATVTFRKQEPITYTSNTKADWISEPVDGTTYTFESSVGKLQNAGYPSNNVNPSSGKATNLTISKISGVPISVQAPKGYVIVRVSYATTRTYDTPEIIAINGEDLAAKSYRDFPKGATTIDLTPGTGLNNPTISSMTFALTKVVAPASLTINPNKTEAVIGQTVSVKIVADDAAFPTPTIYYTRDGSTPVPGANKTETYDPAKGFTLARTVPQTVTINAIAVNSGGQVAAEPVSIVFNDKDHVAPTSISFSQTEGTYPENATFNVKLAADAAAYPTPTLYYTIGGYTAQGDNHIAYDDAQGIDIAKPADGNVVTINAYAVNDAGAVINAATYVFSSETSTATGWIRIQDASQLSDGLNVIVAYAPNGNASTTLSLMTTQEFSNGGLKSTDVTCNNTNGVITGDISNAQHVILEGNATDGWYLKLASDNKYIMPPTKTGDNGLSFSADKSKATPATIDMSDGNAYVTFNGTNYEFVHNQQAHIFAGYYKIAGTQRRAIDFFSEGEYTAGKPYEDLYLVMKTNEIGGAEVAMPFTYEGDGRYTLPVYNLQGTFYIRDGKANHRGTYFGAKADECIDPETSTGYVGHSINAAISAIKGEPSTGVKDGNGKDVYAYVGKNSGRDSYTLIYDPAQESHYVFSTHPNTNIGHVARIDYAMLTVEYTPGSHTDGVLRISGMSTTGVDDISADVNGQARYFNLQGMPVANPTAGIYIRVIGDTATKVCIK